jgi:hypothetical protein
MLRIIIAGSRDFNDYELLKITLNEYLFYNNHLKWNKKEVKIVSGGAIGADALGERYAKENLYYQNIFRPDWKLHGKAAGPIRNKLMAENADVLIVFWNGESKGTADMIKQGEKKGLKVLIIKTKIPC